MIKHVAQHERPKNRSNSPLDKKLGGDPLNWGKIPFWLWGRALPPAVRELASLPKHFAHFFSKFFIFFCLLKIFFAGMHDEGTRDHNDAPQVSGWIRFVSKHVPMRLERILVRSPMGLPRPHRRATGLFAVAAGRARYCIIYIYKNWRRKNSLVNFLKEIRYFFIFQSIFVRAIHKKWFKNGPKEAKATIIEGDFCIILIAESLSSALSIAALKLV